MLSYILRQIQSFERNHGMRPNVVFLSAHCLEALQEQYPQLFREDPIIALGFRIVVLPQELGSHPQVAWLPPQAEAKLQVPTRAQVA
jgi:Fe-S oxidoreductase